MKTPLYLKFINWMQTDFRSLYLLAGFFVTACCMCQLIDTLHPIAASVATMAIIAAEATIFEYYRYKKPHIINWHNVLAALIPAIIVFIFTLIAAIL